MITINMDDWIASGGGGRGVSYFHKDDPNLMLKLDNGSMSVKDLETEIGNAKIVASLGLPTPEPGDVVTDGKLYGLMFKRIQNKVSYARMVGDHPERIPEFAKNFAATVKQLHTTKGNVPGVRNIKDVYGNWIMRNEYISDAFKAKAMRLLSDLADGENCVHGDLHFGNIINADGKDYIIDIGNFGYGNHMFDMAMMLAIQKCGHTDPDLWMQLYHTTPEDGDKFWECFIKEYFGPDAVREEIEKQIFPYYAIRVLTMEPESNVKLPENTRHDAIAFIDNYC